MKQKSKTGYAVNNPNHDFEVAALCAGELLRLIKL